MLHNHSANHNGIDNHFANDNRINNHFANDNGIHNHSTNNDGCCCKQSFKESSIARYERSGLMEMD